MQAAIRPLVPDQGRQLARGLPINKHAFLNQVPALCRHALVVVTDRRQSLGLGAVGEEIANLGSELKRAGFVGRQKTGAGVIRLPQQCAIQFG